MEFQYLYHLFMCGREYAGRRAGLHGISETEHKICAFLYGHPGCSQDDVAKNIRCDKTTVAKAFLTLEKKNYITRKTNPENRRKKQVFLSDKGKEDMRDMVNLYQEWFESVSDCLNPEEQKNFDDYCLRLLRSAGIIREEEYE